MHNFRNIICMFFVFLAGLLFFSGCTELREYKKQVEAITIEDVDLENTADGKKRRLRRGFRKTRQVGSHAAAAAAVSARRSGL